ncbi:cytochrome c oxidase subunit II [Candidatus Nitrosoglobus terrae]|uniref:cytochrome-c oxidase n=1 Tax=Candidatus Nitrosoglobus terrae TaxID=1630141 RepID=A0A1Q2SKP1_9GAMM|nr:cytochrome C oxidase subunit II [Candidatus Nitrosoglobus terrae]BAW79684.1 cytochrome c oxidase subunit II [Candidatus Nitrosoglobus terrae]
MQSAAWYITLISVISLIGVFYFVISNSKVKEEYSSFSKAWYGVRGKWFIFLIILWVTLLIITLKPFPLPSQTENYSDKGDQIIDVSGHQWYWVMSSDTVVIDKPVVFQVTTGDVNHGFGVYNEKLELVAQVQAMPGYTNKLVYTFTQPGKYRILCLEYCGVAHHGMIGELNVKES